MRDVIGHPAALSQAPESAPWQPVPFHKAEILAARAQGESFQSIADRLDQSVSTVWRWVKRWEAGHE